ncbi:MAG TPA: HAD family phosphatase [Candidatus Saccharimonadales bacterium]|nr:HAD family phosphatase [Candidatus Saccharimonadales bacterium]
MKQFNLSDFDAVAFDFDGTLANTIPIHHKARQEAFKRHGFGHITKAQHALGPIYGSTAHDIIGGILQAAGEIKKIGPFDQHETVKAVAVTRKQLVSALVSKGLDEMPGATDFLKAIHSRFHNKVAIVTASPAGWVLPFMKRYKLDEILATDLLIDEEVVTRLQLGYKPSPDPYNLAKQRLGARRLLVFEDNAAGVESAKRAGATVIAMGFEKEIVRQFETKKYLPDVIAMSYNEARYILSM